MDFMQQFLRYGCLTLHFFAFGFALRPENSEEMDPTEVEAEQRHFIDVVRSFLLYESFMKLEIRRRMTHLHALSAEHKALLPEISVRKLNGEK
jgi:hypothetical protein